MSSDSTAAPVPGASAPGLALDRVVLPARAAHGSETRAPVRIFVGTEHAQYRAERVFVWSIERVRDPARRYEIVLMKDLPGFDRSRWLTGFTNYRFLIPSLAEGAGRALYNDIDQVYLADPAELFDRELGERGYLTINPYDTSVMLLDCARMAEVWTPESARAERRKTLEARAAEAGLWGELPGVWNARDAKSREGDTEYRAGESKCVHFTTIHTQPWMPFPERFVYQENPVGHVWHELALSADAAGFELFEAAHPSRAHRALLDSLRASSPAPDEPGAEERDDLAQQLTALRPATVLEMGLGALRPEEPVLAVAGASVTRFDSAQASLDKPPGEPHDVVLWRGGLERAADEDVPWLVEELFRHARRMLVAWIGDDARPVPAEGWRAGVPRDRFAWSRWFEAAAARHPQVHWCVVAHSGRGSERRVTWRRERGHRPGAAPQVLVVDTGSCRARDEALALADALGWPYEVCAPRDAGALDGVDLLLAGGARAGAAAVRLARATRGHARVVRIEEEGGASLDGVDLALASRHLRLLPHPRRLVLPHPLATVTARGAARPDGPLVLLAGGGSAERRFGPTDAAGLGAALASLAGRNGGAAVEAYVAPKTPARVRAELARTLPESARITESASEIAALLSRASAVVVTDDDAGLLADALASGAPVAAHLLPVLSGGPGLRLRRGIAAGAHARPRKRGKGSVRPQRGLEAALSRLLASHRVAMPPDLGAVVARLLEDGRLLPLGRPFTARPASDARPAAVRALHRLLGA